MTGESKKAEGEGMVIVAIKARWLEVLEVLPSSCMG